MIGPRSMILDEADRWLFRAAIVVSLYVAFRGHNAPGGGFAGGLVAAGAFVLHALAAGFPSARRMLWFDPRTVMGLGLLVAGGSGMVAFAHDLPFLTGLWDKTPLPVVGKIGTPLIFDTGVYLLVLGMTCLVVFALGEDD